MLDGTRLTGIQASEHIPATHPLPFPIDSQTHHASALHIFPILGIRRRGFIDAWTLIGDR